MRSLARSPFFFCVAASSAPVSHDTTKSSNEPDRLIYLPMHVSCAVGPAVQHFILAITRCSICAERPKHITR